MSPPVGNAAWAHVVMHALHQAGVRDLVTSPGSRSTPFVIGAASSPLRLHSVIDERSAAFFALGIVRSTGRPAALLCTSGTAGAHYLPALLEARYSQLPLLAITADRPPELHECGALQTIDQRELFAAARKNFVDLGCAHGGVAELEELEQTILRAVEVACTGPQGVVHINAPTRKPLEPQSDELRMGGSTRRAAPRPVANRENSAAPTEITDARWDEVATSLSQAKRALLICGPMSLCTERQRVAISQFSTGANVPVCCEATSQLRFADLGESQRFDALPLVANVLNVPNNEVAKNALHFDVVVRFGATPTTPALQDLSSATTWVVARHGSPDPSKKGRVLSCDVTQFVAETLPRLDPKGPQKKQSNNRTLLHMETLCWQTVAATLNNDSEPAMLRATLAALDQATVVVGNSLPVRELDLFCASGTSACQVLSQRGVAGIDGLVAGAAGVAATRTGAVALVLGDVSLSHDAGSLALCRDLTVPFFVVVLDNGGGRIFDQLPIASDPPRHFAEHWTTAPKVDYPALAQAFGLTYATCDTEEAVAAVLAGRKATATLVHCKVHPHSVSQSLSRIRGQLTPPLRHALGL